jgi:hypothetical protein
LLLWEGVRECDVIFLSPRVGERETTRKVVVILKEKRRRTASVHQYNCLTSETVHREPKERKVWQRGGLYLSFYFIRYRIWKFPHNLALYVLGLLTLSPSRYFLLYVVR